MQRLVIVPPFMCPSVSVEGIHGYMNRVQALNVRYSAE
ncbi:MAG: hypothetical protein QOI55_833, partial [Actinomycetota bacterium]|nr:hypothetical protein [Actinomycetota bacterium]